MGGGPARYCTSEYKTGEVKKLMTRLVRERDPIRRRVRILNIIGIRADEGGLNSERSKKPVFLVDSATNETRRYVHRWHAIHGWPVEKVWQVHHQAELRHHPAYDLGMSRLSCRFCVMAGKDDLVLSALANPELAAEYVALEQELGHSFKPGVSMAEIVREARRKTRRRKT